MCGEVVCIEESWTGYEGAINQSDSKGSRFQLAEMLKEKKFIIVHSVLGAQMNLFPFYVIK